MRLRRIILQKLVHLLRGGRQADQVKVNPSQPQLVISVDSRHQLCLLKLRQHELIDLIKWPTLVTHLRRVRRRDRTPGPVLRFAGLQIECRNFFVTRDLFGPRIRCPHGHPLGQNLDFRIGQLAPGGHPADDVFFVPNCLDQ